ncbi:MAG: hypothetical protein QXU31_03930 [Archaeoglobaceae archaeon]
MEETDFNFHKRCGFTSNYLKAKRGRVYVRGYYGRRVWLFYFKISIKANLPYSDH